MLFKNYPFTKLTTFTAFVMVVSASFTRQLMEFATMHIGRYGFKILIGSILIGMAAVFFIAEAKRLTHPFRIIVMLGLLVCVLFYVWKIKLPQVRMHILMYAVVGWLSSRDAMKSDRTWKTIIVAWIFAAGAGALEELLQKLLPYRIFDVNDIMFNLKGASLGVILYLIRPPVNSFGGA